MVGKMVSIEKQLLELQNQLLEQQKKEMKSQIKIDELAERADFYENLHNQEQADLYEAENQCAVLKNQNQQLKKESDEWQRKLENLQSENERLKKEIETIKLRDVSNMGIKRLFCLILQRVKYKFTGRNKR